MEKKVFESHHKVGDVISYEGKFWIAESSVYQNAADMEDGFDIFLDSGYYTVAHEASPEETQAYLDTLAQTKKQEQDKANSFQVGQTVRRRGSTKTAIVLEVQAEQGMLRLQFGSITSRETAKNFEIA